MSSVRQATVHDVEQLAPLFDAYRQFYGHASDVPGAAAFLRERFVHQQSVIFLACNESGVAVGFVQLFPSFSSARMARIFILNDLYVRESARKSGVARHLLMESARYGAATGAIRLTLSTAHTNAPAQALYSSMGWKLDEVFRTYTLSLGAPSPQGAGAQQSVRGDAPASRVRTST